MLSSDNSRSYTVSLSTNGKVYTRVVDVAGNGLGRTSYYFDQTPASYIRVQIRKGGIIEPDVAYLAELMAYGSVYNGTVAALPGQIADRTDEVRSDVPTPDDVVEPDVDIDVTPDDDVDADPDKKVEIDTSDDVPDRTYFMDSEGNIYYIDDNGDKVLVDEDGKEIGRVPAKTKPKSRHANASPVVWPYIVGGVVLVAAIGGVATLLVVRTKKAKSKPQE